MKLLRLWRGSLPPQSAHVKQTEVSDERFNVCDCAGKKITPWAGPMRSPFCVDEMDA
jgi:hypothetical protein